ncbi:MAG TPA: GGDEF domain-containing protein [Pseudomonadales bacterium]|nr:GGDEF domain-containing protein [Pseudomonadales bacterium]
MPYSYLQTQRLNAFIRKFIVALAVLTVINALRLHYHGEYLIITGQVIVLAILYGLTFVMQARHIALLFFILSWVSTTFSHVQLRDHALAGLLMPVLGPVMAYFFSLRTILIGLVAFFIVSMLVFSLTIASQIPTLEYSFIAMKILILCVSTGFTAVFFDKFAHIFDDKIREERSMRTLFEKQANYDELTQIYSRRGVFKAIETLPESKQFGILLLDIDYFKSVNDLYGHNIGDKYLVAFAARLQEILPKGYILGRIGGEEFLVIAPTNDESEIQHVIAKCLFEIEHLEIETDTGLLSRTCSIGVCIHNRRLSLNAGLKFADTALYQAKLSGRNRSAWYTTEE